MPHEQFRDCNFRMIRLIFAIYQGAVFKWELIGAIRWTPKDDAGWQKRRRKDKSGKEKILAAIRRAAAELGRAPSRGELRRITGVSHYRVLAEFRTLREAVRAAGLEPNPKGEKISTEDLLSDWKRVAEKLGRRPSRAEYVREGKYSAGALTVRFGSWSGKISTAKVAKNAEKKNRLAANLYSSDQRRTRIKTQLPESPKVPKNPKEKAKRPRRNARLGKPGVVKHGRVVKPDESVLHNFNRVPLAPVPGPLVGMRQGDGSGGADGGEYVVEAAGDWQLAFSLQNQNQEFNHKGHEEQVRAGRTGGVRLCGPHEIGAAGIRKEGDLDPSLAVNAPLVQDDRPILPRAAYIKTGR